MDITNLFNIYRFPLNIVNGKGDITAPYPQQREFICFSASDIKVPQKIGLVEAQNIHGLPTPDMVIVISSKFADDTKQYAVQGKDIRHQCQP